MNAALHSFDQIQHMASALATSAMRSDCWLNAQVRGIDRTPLGQPADLLDEPYPEADHHLEILSVPAIVAAEEIAARLKFWDRNNDTEVGSISRGFVRLVEAQDAEYFEVSDLNCRCDRRHQEQPIHHPFAGYSYWTYWLLAVNHINGRAVSLAIAASD